MKKIVFILICVVVYFNTFAEQFITAGKIKYRVVSASDLTLNVYCFESYSDMSSTDSISIPQTVDYANLTFTVVGIDEFAFRSYYGRIGVNGLPQKINTTNTFLLRCTLPPSITTIGPNAFERCTSLISVSLPNSITSIGTNAFNSCTSLRTVTIPNSLTSIDSNVFISCSNLASVIIPNSVTNIDYRAFANCSTLTNIIILATNIPTINNYAFYGVPTYASIHVPCLFVENYRASLNYFSQFFGYGSLGELTLSVNDSLRGSIEIIDTAVCNNPGTIMATANYGYHFALWGDGVTTNPRTIIVEHDTAFTAIFEKNKYCVSGYAEDLVMGSVLGSDSALYLDTVTLVPISNFGYYFSHWNDGNTDNPRKVSASRDSIFTACFDSVSFTMQTFSNNEQMGFTRIGSGDYLAAAVGDFKYLSTQTIYATPTGDNQFMQWSDGVLDNPRIVTIYGDTSFMALFAPKYVLTVYSSNDSMGTVTGGGLFNNNSQAVITAQANYGYHFNNWNDGVTIATRIITVASDTSFTANFARNQYSITATSADQGCGGAAGSTNALYGDSVTLTATAIGHHHFAYWSDGTNQYTNNPLRVKVTKNDNYTAYFEVNQYQVVVFTDGGGNGYVGLEGTNNIGSYDYMSQLSILAVPFSGVRFTGWSDGNIYNPRTFTITKDTSFTALFTADIYSITVNSDNAVMGGVTGEGIYQADSIAEIAAIPNHGYKFDHWQDNNIDNPRDIVVATNQTFTAYFVTYDTLCIHDTTYIDVYVHDTTIVNNYIHDTTYLWQYDTTYIDNYIHDTTIVDNWIYDTTIVVDTLWLTQYDTVWLTLYDTLWLHDTVIVHDTIYITQEGIGDVAEANIKLYQRNGRIVVDGAAGRKVYMYDINGRLLATKQENCDQLLLDVPASGAYLIKVGNLSARKVVVIRN